MKHMMLRILPSTLAAMLLVLVSASPAHAWVPVPAIESHWQPGEKISVFVDPIPADAPPGTSQAVDTVIAAWNAAQRPHCGLILNRVNGGPTGRGIRIDWVDSLPGAFGSTAPGPDGQGVVTIRIRWKLAASPNLNDRGITRILMHEMGHAEALHHSQQSDLMRECNLGDICRVPILALWAVALNSSGPFTFPTADDIAGKKYMFGSCQKDTRCQITSSVSYRPASAAFEANAHRLAGGASWEYEYWVMHASTPSDPRPTTMLSLNLPLGVQEQDLQVVTVPNGWSHRFYPEETYDSPTPGPGDEIVRFDDHPAGGPVLVFEAADPRNGAPVDGTGIRFVVQSPLGPISKRAVTNSRRHDSSVSTVSVPGDRESLAPSPTPTSTPLPSFTPPPTFTPVPSLTPVPSFTPVASLTPRGSVTPSVPPASIAPIYLPANLRGPLGGLSIATAPPPTATATASATPPPTPTSSLVLRPSNAQRWNVQQSIAMPNWIETVDILGNAAVWGGAGNVWVYDLRTLQPLHTLTDHQRYVHSAVFAPDGRSLYSGGADPGGARIRSWDWLNGAEQWSERVADDPWGVHIVVSPDGRHLASEAARDVRVWTIGSAGITLTHDFGWGASPVISSRNIVAYWNASIRLAQLDGSSVINITAPTTDGNFGGPLAFSPDGSLLYAVVADNSIHLWDTTDGSSLGSLEGHGAPIRALQLSPDGRMLLSASEDKSVRIWDTLSLERLHTLDGFGGTVTALAFDRSGERLITGCQDGVVRIWGLDMTPLAQGD